MGYYWVRTTSPTNYISLLATALAFLFHFFCFPEYVLGSLSMLRDACQLRNLDSWLGGNGLRGEWGLLVGAYNTTHQKHFLVKPCASPHNSCITVVGCIRRGGAVV